MKKVQVHLYEQSEPVEFDSVRNTYTKGPLFCVMAPDGTVYKFPIQHIFRVKEWTA